ncbi:MAG TPA: MFS transporter, partial [Acetobacteraceae bacterium]|nr:MFS transporter [Acetobacteraceae bacterium]
MLQNDTVAPTPMAGAMPRRTGTRFRMLWLIIIAVTINYLDRAIIGIAAPGIRHDFGLNAAALGLVFSAFGWTYLLFQMPGGIALDRFGNRVVYTVALIGWSIFTFLQGIVGGIGAFVGMRLGLGVFEAPCFPANSNVVGMWFPRAERGRAISAYTAAEYVGLGFLSPLLFWMMAHLGWRSLFLSTGLIGIVFAAVWWFFYRDPYASKASESEIAHIEAGGGLVRKEVVGTRFELRHVRELFRHRQMWGLFIGQFSVYSTFVFFLTWFPTYLATQRHMA